MANLEILNAKIKEEGYKKGYLAERLGITPNTLANKLKGKQEFFVSEASHLAQILNLENDVMVNIFFAN